MLPYKFMIYNVSFFLSSFLSFITGTNACVRNIEWNLSLLLLLRWYKMLNTALCTDCCKLNEGWHVGFRKRNIVTLVS